jgi:hypothetical protein
MENAEVIMRDVMNLYCSMSSQQINMEKSSIHFAKECNARVCGEIKEILKVHNEALSEKYLDLPTDMDTSVNCAFIYLKD